MNINPSNLSGKFIWNQMNKNEQLTNQSIEKVSSGMRIHRAGDDAAGLSISEKMRAQIRGLSQSGQNIQDAMSLIQTAEAGMAKIHDQLQRMRELFVQGASETLTDHDRSSIQNEVAQLKLGIDDIARDTKFNTQKLLSPTIDIESASKANVIFVIDTTMSMGGAINNVKNNIDQFITSLNDSNIDVTLGLVSYQDINWGGAVNRYSLTTDVNTYKSNLNALTLFSGGNEFPESGLEGIQSGLNYSLQGITHFVLITDAMVHDNADGDGGDNMSVLDIDAIANQLKSNNITLTVIGPNDVNIKNQLSKISNPTNGYYFDLSSNFATQLNVLNLKIQEDVANLIQPLQLDMHVGSNGHDVFKMEMSDLRTVTIGIDTLQLTDSASGMNGITTIDDAIEKVTGERTRMGAYQNRLEHMSNAQSTYLSNLTEAESRIRDTDLAKEMVLLTSKNIILQASQSMMAQANQNSQSVLRLVG